MVGHQIGRRDTLGPQIFHSHVQEISSNRTATEMYDHLTSQLAEQEGITEQLKVTDQWDWVQRMNSVRNRAAEVVWKELICV
ncbi:MAG: TnpV protein [Oscillospiraceae bacterium]|nr:TnpV protein [Oscillospiraceae bacterium]